MGKGLIWSKEELSSLYIRKKLSTKEIAKLKNCNVGTIWYFLKKFGIFIRTKSEAIKLKFSKEPQKGHPHQVLRFWAHEINEDLDSCLNRLRGT